MRRQLHSHRPTAHRQGRATAKNQQEAGLARRMRGQGWLKHT